MKPAGDGGFFVELCVSFAMSAGPKFSLITALVAVIQQHRVCGAEDSSHATDVAWLDYRDRPGNEGEWGALEGYSWPWCWLILGEWCAFSLRVFFFGALDRQPSLITALVAVIQQYRVCGAEDSFHATDVAWLDYRDKPGNEGEWGALEG
ncbi:hypothetical protein ASG50_20570 [Rhizobium sp. Leaf386]|nr:hypothetical protein ASG50_20570 [Rhizobium sp. Leaf386]